MSVKQNPKHNQLIKTLGPQSGLLVSSLYDRGHPIFGLDEAQEILGQNRNSTQQLVFELVQRGIATRLKAGLFRLVPFELGFEREYLGNPYVVARELVQCKREHSYYLSHGSAFDLHQMVTQPQLIVYTTTTRLIRPRTILGTEFRFVRCKPTHLFGVSEMWVEKTDQIQVSDLERTLLDGLKQPDYCGGLSEVVKGLFIKRDSIDSKKIVDYALRLNVGSVIRRLGFLLEFFEVKAMTDIERLRASLSSTYCSLDPSLPPKGKHIAKWRLCLNLGEDELHSLVRT